MPRNNHPASSDSASGDPLKTVTLFKCGHTHACRRYLELRIEEPCSPAESGTGNLPNVRKPGTRPKGGVCVRSTNNSDHFKVRSLSIFNMKHQLISIDFRVSSFQNLEGTMKKDTIRVLCVEDEAHDRELIRHALEKASEGFTMTEAGDREAFEALLDGCDCDVVLTDFNILGFQGLEVIRLVRARRPEIPVVVVTGTGSEEIAVQSLKEGAEDYVIKTPRHIAQLPETVRRVLKARKTRDDLRERDENLRALVARTADGILVVDHAGEILFSNPAAEDMLGQKAQELVGQVFGHPIGNQYTLEIDLRRKSGVTRTAAMRVAQTVWNGKAAFIVSLRDITKRKQMEKALKESETEYRQLIDTLNEGIWKMDAEGYTTFVNPRMAEMLGYAVREMVGIHLFDFLDDEWVEDAKTKLKRLHEGIREQHEFTFKNQNGEPVNVLVNASPIFDDQGNYDGTLAGVTDISLLKNAEEVLRERETFLNTLLEAIPIPVFYKDKEGRYLGFNKAFEGFFGETRERLIGKTVFDISPPELAEIYHTRDNELIEKGETQTYESQVKNVDGQLRDVIFNKAAFTNRKGKIGGLIGGILDITEQKTAEKEREKMQAQLHQAQKMESVGRLAGGVAHDFNNKLGVILGYAEMMLTELTPEDPMTEDLREIVVAAKHSTDLARQLLAFARKQTISPVVMDLNETVEGMLKMLRRLIGENIELSWHPDTSLWPVKMDPAQVDQILANLCVNARDAIEDVGTVVISTKNVVLDAESYVDFEGRVPGEYVLLSVRDDGCGMNQETLEKIFEPFFTTKEIDKGTGLGLSTVYGIVKQNKGSIHALSRVGQGTTFHIYIPRHTAAETGGADAPTEEVPLARGETVLMVEDDAAVLNMGRRMLEGLGYRVIAAGSPEAAITMALEWPDTIHLLVTDVVMPELSGADLSRQIQQICPEIKTLIMSGYPADAIADHGVLDRGVIFMPKPFTMQGLAQKVREALDEIA